MEEIWKDIEGFEGMYKVSNLGRVKSLPRFINNDYKNKKIGFYSKERILKPSKRKYAIVGLSKNGKSYWFCVHRLVARLFLPNPDNLPEVDHLDGDKLNNHVDNLEWVTPKENVKRSWEKGLCKPHGVEKGTINDYSKSLCKKVLQYDLKGNLIKTYNSTREAGRFNNYNSGNISSCCNNRQRSAYGYIWKYANK